MCVVTTLVGSRRFVAFFVEQAEIDQYVQVGINRVETKREEVS